MQELRADDEGEVRPDGEGVLGVGRAVLRVVEHRRGQRALGGVPDVDVPGLVVLAVVHVHAGDEPVAAPAEAAVVGDAREPAEVVDGVVDVLEDRVVDVAVDAEDAEVQRRGRPEAERGLVGDTHRVDVALLILQHPDGVGGRRRAQRRRLGHLAGDAPVPGIRVDVEARLGVRRELDADIAGEALHVAVAVLAKAVGPLRRSGDEVVESPRGAAGARLRLHLAEAADIEARVDRGRIAAGRRDEDDRAAERIGAVAQRVGALVDLDIAVGGRIHLEEIDQAVGGVDRDAVHVDVQAAVAVAARQPGAADRHPSIGSPARLRDDAGHPAEHVLDGRRRPALERGVGDDVDPAGVRSMLAVACAVFGTVSAPPRL